MESAVTLTVAVLALDIEASDSRQQTSVPSTPCRQPQAEAVEAAIR